MTGYFSERLSGLEPYVPGEQPRDRRFIKLNTNESPYPPAPGTAEAVAKAASSLSLYPDPDMRDLKKTAAQVYGVAPENVILTNGSDETLSFAFVAFCDDSTGAVFPDVSYGFYPVFATVHSVAYRTVPLEADLSLDPQKYHGAKGTVFIANPNAPTGIAISRKDVEGILLSNPDNVVVIDEAYVDFGAESCVPLIEKYRNLLVVQTFSKSRSLAGARFGLGFACPELIADLEAVRNSENPYNVNRMTEAAARVALLDGKYFRENCRKIAQTRDDTVPRLKSLGFECTESLANFIFARHPDFSGEYIYRYLREQGILVRHFRGARTDGWNRISVGLPEDMDALVNALAGITEEKR